MININYNKLFTIELLHKFYVSGNFDDFLIAPTAKTQKILDAHGIIAKQINNNLFAYVQTNANKPAIIPENGTQLTFLLFLNNSVFFNYTSLSAANKNSNKYYFTNRNNNVGGTKNFLAVKPGKYNTATKYSYEDIIIKSGTTFQSVNNNNNSAPNTAAWRNMGSECFVSTADIVLWKPSVFEVLLNPVTPSADVTVKGYDGADYTATVFTKTFTNPYSLPKIQVDFSSLANGKYLLSVNGNVSTIYLNNELATTGAFGLIDIFIENTLPDDYAILNQTAAHKNELLSPVAQQNKLNSFRKIKTGTIINFPPDERKNYFK